MGDGVVQVDVVEAARRLSLSRSTVERLVQRGDLPSYQLPGLRSRRILVADLERVAREARDRAVAASASRPVENVRVAS